MKLLVVVLGCIPSIALAQPVLLEVETLSETVQLEQKIESAISHATVDIDGTGYRLQLHYSSQSPLEVFILPIVGGRFDPLESLTSTLPSGTHEVLLPLHTSPAWSPWLKSYRVHLLSKDEEGAQFTKMEIVPTPVLAIPQITLEQFLALEPYTPSSYHRLRGPKIFGLSMTGTLGLALFIGVCILVMKKREHIALLVILLTLLATQVRFSLDVMRFSIAHLREWKNEQTYSTSGSLHLIADYVRKEKIPALRLCSSGTTYAQTILRYALYPVILMETGASHTLVAKSLSWSFENGVLTCNDASLSAKEVQRFPDGSILFKHS